MSHAAVSHQQFGEQLKMFMTPHEIIQGAWKGDTELRGTVTPADTWEAKGSGYRGYSTLRDTKLADLEPGGSHYKKFYGKHKPWDTVPPVELRHSRRLDEPPFLTEGHHRLAFAEKHDIPFIAVVHHAPEPRRA